MKNLSMFYFVAMLGFRIYFYLMSLISSNKYMLGASYVTFTVLVDTNTANNKISEITVFFELTF